MPPSSAGDRTTTTSRATWANKPFQAHIRQTPSPDPGGRFRVPVGAESGRFPPVSDRSARHFTPERHPHLSGLHPAAEIRRLAGRG